MATIRTLTDSQRGQLGYGGPAVALSLGVDIDDVKRDVHCPSGSALAYYKDQFNSAGFMAFVQDVITKPTGTALGGRLTWRT